MAEALWRELGQGRWVAESAGSEPTGAVHPLALEVLDADGHATAGLRSKSLDEFAGQTFDQVVTVCDHAAQSCPVFPGSRPLHWPFPDPAHFEGSPAERRHQFAVARDSIRLRIAEHLGLDSRDAFCTWMEQRLEQQPGVAPDDRADYAALVEAIADLFSTPRDLWTRLPEAVHDRFGSRGWAWNGIYELERAPAVSDPGSDPDAPVLDRLVLRAAKGPPVCSELVRTGGVGSSGMCFDAVLTGQSLAAARTKAWRGYHSCDAESGLSTVAGMVVPIRDRAGRIRAVWDLDATEPMRATDLAFFDALLASLSCGAPFAIDTM